MSEEVGYEDVCMLGKRLGVKRLLLCFLLGIRFGGVVIFFCLGGGFLRDGDASPLFHRRFDFACCFIPVIGERDVAIGKIPNAHVNADNVVMFFSPSHCCCFICLAILTSEGGFKFGSAKISTNACAQVRFCAGRVYAN